MSRKTKKMVVYERLKAGDPVSEVRKEIGSGSIFTDGLRMYRDWAEPQVGKLQSEVADLTQSLEERRGEHAEVLREIEEEATRRDELGAMVDARSGELEALEVWITETRSELEEVNAALDDLRKKGVTNEAISRIGRIDFGEGDELLERIGTVERHQELVRANKAFVEENQEKMSEYQERLGKLKDLNEAVNSEKNALDEAVRRRAMYLGANEVVQGFLEEGYDTKLLLSLLEVLRGLSVKDQPNTSIQRIIDGLSGYRRLTELQTECNKKEIELARLTKELDHTEVTLNLIKDTVLEEFKKTEEESIKNMNEQASTAMKLTKDLKDLFETNLTGVKNDQIENLEQVKTAAVNYVSEVSGSARDEIQKASTSLDVYIKRYEKAVSEWGEIKEKQGRLKEFMKYGEIIHDIYENRIAAKEIPLEIIVRLVHTVMYWVYENNPDAEAIPDEGTRRIDQDLSLYKKYKILALMDMVTKSLTARARGVT